MPLSSYDVKQQLILHCNYFLSQPHSFTTLHSYLINKSNLSEINSSISQEITAIKELDKKEAQETLERAMDKQQIAEDRIEEDRDNRDENRESQEKTRLHSELTLLSLSLLNYQGQIATLQQFIARKAHTHAHTHEHSHINQEQTHHHPSTGGEQRLANSALTHAHTHHPHPSQQQHHHHRREQDPDELRLLNLQSSVAFTARRIGEINERTLQLERRSQEREQNRRQRNVRLNARLSLAKKDNYGVTIYDTLTSANGAELKRKINASMEALESKSRLLINEASRHNYTLFLQQLELSVHNLPLTPVEIETLRQAIQYMKKHFEHVDAVNTTQTQLVQVNQAIASLQAKVQQDKARVAALLQANPTLTHQNKTLSESNSQLIILQQKNQQSRDKFFTPSWILASLTLVTCIPLLLTLGGVLPIFLAPILFYTLVSIPSLSFFASLVTGLTALVFSIKGKLNQDQMQANLNTIKLNNEQMGTNDQERVLLETHTIPYSIQQINDFSQQKITLESSLEEKKSLAAQSLQQACSITPSYETTNIGFFKPSQPYYPEPSAPPLDLNSTLYPMH